MYVRHRSYGKSSMRLPTQLRRYLVFLWHSCLILALLSHLAVTIPAPAQATTPTPLSPGWSIQVVDNTVRSPTYNSIALDSLGRPGIAYVDNDRGLLKYAHWNGIAWDIEAVPLG